jgi:hypothetical protein
MTRTELAEQEHRLAESKEERDFVRELLEERKG